MNYPKFRTPLAADFKRATDVRAKVVESASKRTLIEPRTWPRGQFGVPGVCDSRFDRRLKQPVKVRPRVRSADVPKRSILQIEQKRRIADVQATRAAVIAVKGWFIGNRYCSFNSARRNADIHRGSGCILGNLLDC